MLIRLFILWRSGRLSHFRWSTRDLVATMLIGFGMFNLVEGIVDHHVLGHVNELSIVNVIFFGDRSRTDGWVLIDTGLPTSPDTIKECAERRFGRNARPSAIIMTHAHFDHAGSVKTLSADWDVPVYAHPLELPYLNGQASYPPADPLAGVGLMTILSPLFPRSPVNVGKYLRILPPDQTVPGMPEWKWLHTPGNSPGHVSLWREPDRALIAGDAIITTSQESVNEVMMQKPEMHGPPRYFTPDWEDAERSVATLASLEPELVINGHGMPVQGAGTRRGLHRLADNFREIAVPQGGRYDLAPAMPGKSDSDAYRLMGAAVILQINAVGSERLPEIAVRESTNR